ncbi:MAG TPA: ABC transporter substrate-binding protein, partial [Acidimicrobiales bacterium]|nr:ABC transporter substrate-binding protein [Acidimicrobiales bacterium]
MALVVALVLASCGKGSGATSSNATTSGSSNAPAIRGGTATFAERPGTKPDYIFPMLGLSHYSVANIEQFQRLMYRSLYWIGKGGHPVLNEALSLAHKPVYTDGNRKVTITLKPYRWSNGQPVTARDVTFWINLLKANKTSFAGYTPGEFPDNVTHVKVTGERTLTLTLNAPYSPTWFTYNQLSQITPLPQRVWDKTSATAPVGSADTTTAGAKKVFRFLTSQAKDTATYGSNPLWKVVDGPWMLTTYHNDGYAAFVPNRRYSGADKPKLAKFVERPFTSASSELSALRSGSTIDYGYLPLQESQQKQALASSGYRTDPWYTWGITYMVLNFHNPRVGPIFNQLYARQALQYIVDQPAYTSRALHGYGHPTTGPVPTRPSNPYVSPAESHVPYPPQHGESDVPAPAPRLERPPGWGGHLRASGERAGPVRCRDPRRDPAQPQPHVRVGHPRRPPGDAGVRLRCLQGGHPHPPHQGAVQQRGQHGLPLPSPAGKLLLADRQLGRWLDLRRGPLSQRGSALRHQRGIQLRQLRQSGDRPVDPGHRPSGRSV